ncbi:MAG: hypothetical protein WDN49_27195 [Acetobacteraceae bacterium]
MRTLWESGNSLESALNLLSDPAHIGFSWIAAGAGWLFSEMIQIVGQQVLGGAGEAPGRLLAAGAGAIGSGVGQPGGGGLKPDHPAESA